MQRPLMTPAPSGPRVEQLMRERLLRVWCDTDRLFAVLMLLQWVAAIIVAVTFSPYAWEGLSRSVHLHVYMAVILGGALSALPVALAWLQPGRASTRYTIAVAQMLWSGLLIHLTGGRIETHFHVFGSLALLSFYREWRVLVPASVVVTIDHFVRGLYWPESVYGISRPELWRVVEHGAWVVFIDIFLVVACIYWQREMRVVAAERARAEALSESERAKSAQLDEALAELRRANERFELAALATNDLMWDRDMTTGVVWLSPSKQRFRCEDRTVDDAGLWTRNIHPDDADRVFAAVQAAIDSRSTFWSAEYRFRRFDEGYAEVLDRAYVAYDERGVPVRMIGAVTDLSEHHAAQRALAHLSRQNELILNSAAEGIFGIDTDGIAQFVNPAAAAMIGWAADEIIGRNIHEILHDAQSGEAPFLWEQSPAHRTIRTGEPTHSSSDSFRRKDGSTLPVEYSCRPMRGEHGEVIGAVVTFRDITERQAVERLKMEFVSVVSHELRTPLTSIRGALGLLASGALGKVNEKGQRMLDIAVINTDRLVRLINDILDIDRLESGKAMLTRGACDARAIAESAVEVVRAAAEKSGIEIRVDVAEAPLWADPDRLVQTLTNLLGNAIKFSPAGSVVTVRTRQRGKELLFDVADQGRGIPADKLESIFERFHQVDASDSRDKGGSGLGLAICRSIVRQHGGEIGVESTPGRGSCFTFSIPLSGSPSLPHVPAAARVLVCEADPQLAESMVRMLERHGYEVTTVQTGEELLRQAPVVGPDAILVDLFMRDVSGSAILAGLRQEPATANVPVLITSALSSRDIESLPAAVAGWIARPIEEETLVRMVGAALERDPRRARVLIVEDDVDLVRVVATALERHGIDIVHAATGAAAIEAAQVTAPDLLVLDLALPDMDGCRVVEWFRDHEPLASVPLVVYSAREVSPTDRDQLRLGPTEYLTKSRVHPDEFERRIVEILSSVVSRRGVLGDAA